MQSSDACGHRLFAKRFDFCRRRIYIAAMDARQFHDHYRLQAEWLAPSRHFLYRKIDLTRRENILDLGCGSGVISEEIRQICGRPVLGVDRDPEILSFAHSAYPENRYGVADENDLLQKRERFDLIVLSFVLLWQARPLLFLKKIKKLLRADGVLLVLAEPDYGGRIDFPVQLDFLKDIFCRHIMQLGGDPFLGRKLRSFLQKAGFQAEVDLASCLNFPGSYQDAVWNREWRFWQELASLSDATLKKIRRLEKNAACHRERLVIFPVLYAIASAL
jgi:ubiquinone/menaquinone biosynthesis C-methylase UbiE